MPLNYCPIPLSPPLFTHGKGKPREKGSGLYLKFRRWKGPWLYPFISSGKVYLNWEEEVEARQIEQVTWLPRWEGLAMCKSWN